MAAKGVRIRTGLESPGFGRGFLLGLLRIHLNSAWSAGHGLGAVTAGSFKKVASQTGPVAVAERRRGDN
jgi:hypothetical protein